MNKRMIGAEKETAACDFLQKRGYRILEKNFRCRIGEIDIIAKDGKYLCFIEVKYRRTPKAGYPHEAINLHKQNKIWKVANYYLLTHGFTDSIPCRFDAVLITGSACSLIQNAFMG